MDTNTESSGRYHSNWLSMMQSRLLLARNLLRDDGVIFISIDDNEVHNLRKLMDEIFGEENFVGQVTWKARVKPVNIGDAKYKPQCEVEYVIIYQKAQGEVKFRPLMTGGVRNYNHEINGRRYRLATILKSNRGSNQRSTMTFDLNGYTPPAGQRWQAGEDVINHLWTTDYIEFVEGTPFRRYFEDEEGAEHDPFYCFMEVDWSSTSEVGKSELNNLLGNDHGFDTVKPVRLLKTLIQSCTTGDDLILDFFAGSGTTAHAIMELNGDEDAKRKFILVQLPEATDEKSGTFKAGYKTISQITIERVKRAGTKTEAVKPEVDTGFRVLRLSKSLFPQNMFEVNPDMSEEQKVKAWEEYLERSKQSHLFDFKPDELLVEIALKDGFDLNFKAESVKAFKKNNVLDVSDGEKTALICLDENIQEDTIKDLEPYKERRFICLERAVDSTRKWNLKRMFGDNLWVA
jgi:adenine-specific DNA-methyltransferase